MHRYNDAITSARKAIDINSLNAKAWGQVAEAYGRLVVSILRH